MKTLTIIIPVYNEEMYITTTLKRVVESDSLRYKKEIIIIDDCSKDNTISKVREFLTAQRDKNVSINLIEKKQNEGKGAAIKEGILKSRGDIVLIQDSDLEYNPKDYPQLLRPFIEMNADVVYGSRFVTNQPRRVLYFWHYVANQLLTLLSNMLTNLNITDMETGYKVFKGDIIRKIAPRLQSKRFGFEPEITARIAKIKNIKFYEIGISYQGRTYEEGKKIGWKDGIKAFFEIIKYWIVK